LICRYLNKKTLIIVPSIDLVNQLYRNFEEYGYNADKNVHRIYQGQEKSSDKLITISTWQSIKDLDEEYFSQYNVIIGDEVHTFTGPSLKGIMERTSCSEYKIGMTGTLDDAVCHRLLLEGLFGEIKEIVTAKKLMDIGINTPLNINVIILKHLISERNIVKDSSYIEEIDFIEKHERRNKFIQNLALDKNENILILYKHIDNHGSIIYNNLKKLTNRPIFFINGRVSKDIREEVIKIIDTHSNAIVIATYNTFSTGINIKKLHHLIFASPHKNKKKVIQSIGRLLRKSNGKEICNLYDIADDFSIDGEMNHTLKHLAHRLKSYNSEQFKYKIYKIELNE
jgi:superfamily II DNA or RNA helicase